MVDSSNNPCDDLRWANSGRVRVRGRGGGRRRRREGW